MFKQATRTNCRTRFRSATWLFAMIAWVAVGCDQSPILESGNSATPKTKREATASPIVTAARSQIGKTLSYDPTYVGLAYPNGDISIETGVCTDVVIRALRDACKIDLQKLVHEDMKAVFSAYPKIWGLKKPDPNIDHRRVPNLKTYFKRRSCSLAVTRKAKDYLPGDLVTCTVGRNLAHIMIVSDKKTPAGVPFVIHNIGNGAKEENRLFDFPITGHYRIKE
jgi:uncharacterized protein YijF (DUF1287 family)